MLRLQSGCFDKWPRLFHSVPSTWTACVEGASTLMELIPEFFDLSDVGDWLHNRLGVTPAEGPLESVELPPWARNPQDLILKMRGALESEYVSQHLHLWIDLIFGCKQNGAAALEARNLFHPVCYAPQELAANGKVKGIYGELPVHVLEAQVREFGQVPRQLFLEPHPARRVIPKWPLEKLRKEESMAQPWYVAAESLTAEEAPPDAPTPPPPPPRGAGGARVDVLGRLRVCASLSLQCAGQVTGVAVAGDSICSVGEDGCLRVVKYPTEEDGSPTAADRKNFSLSSMPLSALCVVDAPDLLAIGGVDGNVCLFSMTAGRVTQGQRLHEDTVTCFAMCGSTLVSGSDDQTVRVWQTSEKGLKPLEAFDELEADVTAVCMHSSGVVLAGGADGQVLGWSTDRGEVVMRRSHEASIAGVSLSVEGARAASLDIRGEVRLWDLRTNSEALRTSVGRCIPRSCCLITDCTSWALVSGTSPSSGAAVCLWDLLGQREAMSWTLEGTEEGTWLQWGRGENGSTELVAAGKAGRAFVFRKPP